ncbi:unnamed protein product [Coccothraustes coccothraustes]
MGRDEAALRRGPPAQPGSDASPGAPAQSRPRAGVRQGEPVQPWLEAPARKKSFLLQPDPAFIAARGIGLRVVCMNPMNTEHSGNVTFRQIMQENHSHNEVKNY